MGTIPVAVSVYEKLALARLELVAEEVLRSRCADIVPDFRLDWDYFCRWPLPDKLALAASPGACDWLERTQIYIDQGLFDRYAAQYASRHLKNFCALLLFFLSETSPSGSGLVWPRRGAGLVLARGALIVHIPFNGALPLRWTFAGGELQLDNVLGRAALAVRYTGVSTARIFDSDWAVTWTQCFAGIPIGLWGTAYREAREPEVVSPSVIADLTRSYQALPAATSMVLARVVYSVVVQEHRPCLPGEVPLNLLLQSPTMAVALEDQLLRRAVHINSCLNPSLLSPELQAEDCLEYDFSTLPGLTICPSRVVVRKSVRSRSSVVDWSLVDMLARLPKCHIEQIGKAVLRLSCGNKEAADFLSACCCYCLQEFDDSERLLRQCLYHAPDTEEFWILLAFALRHQGRKKEFDEMVFQASSEPS